MSNNVGMFLRKFVKKFRICDISENIEAVFGETASQSEILHHLIYILHYN